MQKIIPRNGFRYSFADEGNYALQEFLAARNPRQQHSSTLESYLIKPIQRILKYPLLLQQLINIIDSNTDEHLHLVGELDLEFEHKERLHLGNFSVHLRRHLTSH